MTTDIVLRTLVSNRGEIAGGCNTWRPLRLIFPPYRFEGRPMATRSPAKTMYSGAPALEAARQAFRSAFAAGYDRLFLWIPVVFGVGIGTYFGLAEEPDRFVGPLATALCAIAAIA
ncbi:MAG: hypothetical protein VW547_04450, partial [Alphaproteobacteria bacterium]